MRDDDKYFYWKKGESPVLSKNFNGAEFSCTCHNDDCIEQKIAKELIKILQEIRDVSNTNVKIDSGFRCHKKQQELIKQEVNTVVAKKSAHEDGLAADITSPSMVFREFYKKYVEPRFWNIGLAKSFCHVDIRPKKLDGTKRMWYY